MNVLVSQGAEAKLYKISENNNFFIIKDRMPKSYRIKEIDDSLRKFRNKREIDLLDRASRIIKVPRIIRHDKFSIVMEFIDGKKLSEALDDFQEDERIRICKKIGNYVAVLHDNNIIHGDLTTSNMIIKNNELYFIDFGLGFIDQKDEHKAVDLHLLKQALESKHYKHFEDSFKAVLDGYKEYSKEFVKVMERFNKVERRGRYKNK